jgi:hypothetical protein
MKVTTHINLVPRLKVGGAVPPLLHTFPWRTRTTLSYLTDLKLSWMAKLRLITNFVYLF